jgi:Transposase DDE domain
MAEMSRIRHLLEQHIIQDLFTIVYVVVDDYLKLSHEQQRFRLPKSTTQKASYAEIMTISLIGDLFREPHSEHWFIKVKLGFSHLFKELPHITRYHRILKNLEGIMADFALCLANTVEDDTVYITDSKPLPVCRDKRRFQPRAMTEATRGFSTMGATFGFKLHAVVNNAQMMCRFAIVPANVADPKVCQMLLNDNEDDLSLVLGDKAYVGCGIFTPPKKNAKNPIVWSKLMDSARKVVETVFSSLTRGCFLVLNQLNSFWSVRASVCRKIAAHNLGLWLGL